MSKCLKVLVVIPVFMGCLFAGNFSAGIKGGISIHELHLVFSPQNNPIVMIFNFRIGPTLSLIGEFDNYRFFGQQFGIGYYQAGGVLQMPEYDELGRETGTGKEIIKLDYLFLSYCVKGKLKYQYFEPYILLGIQIDYMINCDDVYISSNNIAHIMHTFKYTELNKNNITPVLGIGMSYHIHKSDIFIEYLPYFHLLPFYQHDITSDNIGAKHTTNGHVINLGIKYDW
jgi:hypothetical protein